jgi:hypothetical protein
MSTGPEIRPVLRSWAAALGLLGLLACGGGDHAAPPPVDDVFVAGYESTGVDVGGSIPNVAKIWTNGVRRDLTSGGPAGGVATAVTVSRGDVYVAGQDGAVVTYWKNGTPVALTDGTQYGWANAIYVSGDDVYLGGGEGNLVKYWKNGVPVTLTDGKAGGTVWGLAVSGKDVYAVGFVYGNTQVGPNSYVIAPVATYWKNGAAVSLSDGTRSAVLTAVAVSGGDLYMAGFEAGDEVNGTAPYLAKVWKNGVPVVLTPSTLGAVAKAIAVVGSDVYVAGYEDSGPAVVAKYWKNGAPVNLTHGPRDAVATGIAVWGTDVYVSGAEHNGQAWGAKVWKNGVPTLLSGGTLDANALGLAVVRR